MNSSIIAFDDVSFTYPTRELPSLKNLGFEINKGDFVLVTGPTGCGKSTLLKVLNGIIPFLSKGKLKGTISIAGLDSRSGGMDALTREVGLVFQNPNDQIVSNSVEEEIAFGLENLNLEEMEIRNRIEWACTQVSIGDLRERDPNSLSGGQKQRVVIASQIAMHPKILALDEPLSCLDPQSALEVMECIASLNRQVITIVMVEHRVSFVAPKCSHIMILNHGKLINYSTRDDAFMRFGDLFTTHGLEIPAEVHICKRTKSPMLTFNEEELSELVKNTIDEKSIHDFLIEEKTHKSLHQNVPGNSVSIENVTFGYTKEKILLKDFSLSIRKGEFVALMGANGTGKSTLMSLIAGLNKPAKGRVTVDGHDSYKLRIRKRAALLGFLIQNPDLMLFCDTVYDELAFGPRHVYRKSSGVDEVIDKTLELLGLTPLRDLPAFSLSMGQRLRTAFGAVLSLQPHVLLLDEPTTGQNEENIRRLMNSLRQMNHLETTIFCTHDFNTAIEHADRIVILINGSIVADGTPQKILGQAEILRKAGLQLPLLTRITHSLGLPEAMYIPRNFSKVLLQKNIEPAGV